MRSPWAIPNDPRMHEPPGVGQDAVTGSAHKRETSGDPVRPARTPRVHEYVITPDGPGRVRNIVRHGPGREITAVLVHLYSDKAAHEEPLWRSYRLDQLEYSTK